LSHLAPKRVQLARVGSGSLVHTGRSLQYFIIDQSLLLDYALVVLDLLLLALHDVLQVLLLGAEATWVLRWDVSSAHHFSQLVIALARRALRI
jgi:hypothetical protein